MGAAWPRHGETRESAGIILRPEYSRTQLSNSKLLSELKMGMISESDVATIRPSRAKATDKIFAEAG
uniref:Uncharacterized protein n=1 Tax=Moniliophthora roreri TaxID=221103 RepID=A0A0W0G2B4_MONRR